MDAQPPQRVIRAPPKNNENMAPLMFPNNHQWQKFAGAPALKEAGIVPLVTVPAKRTAFGDVSNVVRPLTADTNPHGLKPPIANALSKPDTLAPAFMTSLPAARNTKESVTVPAPASGLLAPAQRPRNSAGAILSVPPVAESYPQENVQNALPPAPVPSMAAEPSEAVRKPTVMFSNEVVYSEAPAVPQHGVPTSTAGGSANNNFAEAGVANWIVPKRSPRHSKSQPCLKTTDVLQQQPKQPLRRALSRLPLERNSDNGLVVFADGNAGGAAGALSDENKFVALAADAFDDLDAAFDIDIDLRNSLDVGNIAETKNTNGAPDAADAPFVDAVEDFRDMVLPPLPDEADDDIGRLQKDIEAAAIMTEEPPKPVESAVTYLPPVEQPVANYLLSDMPQATVASALSEVEEPWDDDADFYDDQAYTTAHSFRSFGDTTMALTTVVMPKITAKIQNELEIARAIVEASTSPEELEDESWDISMVAEYAEDIYGYMKELEIKLLPNPYYMDMQPEIQWSMRTILMEWLIHVHQRFKLLPETLFLAVNYIDRFLSSKIVSVARLQLVGAAAIFIAAKYEEIICPSIQEIIFMVDGGYKAAEILKAECYMLSILNFELGWPGPMIFLRRISKADEYDEETRTLAKYFLEVAVMDERFVACPPSFLAAGAHCLARLMLFKGDWSTAHVHYSGYTWSQVLPLASTLLYCCRDPIAHHAAVYDKYASSKFKKSSLYVEEEMHRGFALPPLQVPQHSSRQRLSLTESFCDCAEGCGTRVRTSHSDVLIRSGS